MDFKIISQRFILLPRSLVQRSVQFPPGCRAGSGGFGLIWFHLHQVLQSWAQDEGSQRGEPEGSKVQTSLFFASWTKVRGDGLQNEGGHPSGSRAEGPPTTGG